MKRKKDILIPASLITKARRLGACRDALEWLTAEPRTFTALVTDNPTWGAWAIRHMCSASAQEAYDMAIAPAWEAYNNAIAPAWEAYDKAAASAQEARKAAAPAREAYDMAIAPAREAYDKAAAPARLTALLTLVTRPEEKQ